MKVIRKSLYTIKVFTFLINQISVAFAMDFPEKRSMRRAPLPLPLSSAEKLERNQLPALPHILISHILIHLDDKSLGRMAQVSQQWQHFVHGKRVAENPYLYHLPNPLIAPGYDLNKAILSTLNAIPDPFTPLIQNIRSTCGTLTSDQQSLIRETLPNLINPSLSLYPWHLLRQVEALKLHDFKDLPPDALLHEGFVRIKEVKGLLQTIAVRIPSIASCLKDLNKQYDRYLNGLCRSVPQAREIFISPVFLEGDFLHGAYLMPQSLSYKLFSMGELGIPEKRNLTGSSIVSQVGTLYAKQTLVKKRLNYFQTEPLGLTEGALLKGTLDPGMEWGMSGFHRLLFGEGMVPSSLLVISHIPIKKPLSPEIQKKEHFLHEKAHDNNTAAIDRKALLDRLSEDLYFKSTYTSALQVTPEVEGIFLEDFLKQALQNPQLFKELDKDQVQGLILSAMLTHPADAKGDNFIVTNPNIGGKRQIIGIDNDMALASFIIKEHEDFHTLETRHLLFCIPYFMEQKITTTLQKRLLSLSAPHVVMTWLKSLEHHNQQYERLQKTLDPSSMDLLKLPLKLQSKAGISLLKRIEALQRCLQSYTLFTPKLKNFFEEISPLSALYIKRLLKEEPEPLKAFKFLYRQEKPFEQLFSQEEDFNGHTLSELLAREGKAKGAYEIRSHTVEDSAEEILRHISFSSLSLPQIHLLLEEAVVSFPKALRASLPSFPPSLYTILGLNPSAALVEAMIECPSHRLTPQQMFNLARQILKSSLSQKSFLLEKLLSLPGFNSSRKDEKGNTLLHLWAQFPHIQIPTILWENWKAQGENCEALNRQGESSLDRALATEHLGLIEGLLTLNKNKKLSYHDHILEQFYQKVKTQAFWKADPRPSLHTLFQLRSNQDPHWRWVLKRTKLFSSTGEPIDILTTNQGRIEQEKRTLAPDIVSQLWDKKGNFIAYHTNKYRMVGRVIFDSSKNPNNPQKKAIYFKRFPSLPGMSMAISLLQEMLFGEGFLPFTFARIKGEPFLISPGIGTLEKDDKGSFCEFGNLDRLLTSKASNDIDRLDHLDEDALAQVIIMAMLTNPEDGKPSNYALEVIKSTGKERIMGFDEEQAFVPAVSKLPETFLERLNSVVVQMKSILFCMDAMSKPIPQKVKDTILKWDEFKLIKDWVSSLQILNQKMQALFKGSIPSLFNKYESYIGIPFQKGETTALLNKIHILKTYIEKHSPKSNPLPVTLFDVFWHVEPFAALRYAPILKDLKNHPLRDRFLIIDGGIYEQNQGIFERTFSQKEQFPSSLRSGHLLNARQIPRFEDRKETLKKGGKGFDPQLALEELAEQEVLIAQEGLKGFQSPSFLQASTVASLQQEKLCPVISLESFQAVPPPYQRMVISLLKGQTPQRLQLYFSTELTSESLKDMTLSQLTFLNLKGCENLDDKALTFLNNLPKLHTLNLSYIKGIRNFSIEKAPVLELLHLGKCERLQGIQCQGSKLKVIKASHNPALTIIRLNTPQLETLDLRHNKSLALETVLSVARTWTSLQDLNIEDCEKMPLKSLQMPLQGAYVNQLLGRLKKEEDPKEQYSIGYMYHHGQGVKVNYEEALRWYHRAANQGFAAAYHHIGYMYCLGHGVKVDYEESLKYLQLGVDKGSAKSLHCIGHLHHYGQGVPQDLKKARGYYEKAAEAGDMGAYYKLGGMYEYGEGVSQNYVQALSCYKKAATKDDDWLRSDIQYRIAYFYDRGLGTQKDPIKTQEEYKKTYEISLKQVEEGNYCAYETLGQLYLRGKGIAKDHHLAFKWFKKATEANEKRTQTLFGRCYKEGWGIPRNLQLAYLWIEKSANNNHPICPYNLALLYRDGEGVEQEDQKAVELLEKLVQQHSYPDAFYSLGWMHEQGRGTPKDLEKAKYYYAEGTKRHAEDALYSIGRIYEYGLGGEPVDLEKAKQWYQEAANLGYEMAISKLNTFKN